MVQEVLYYFLFSNHFFLLASITELFKISETSLLRVFLSLTVLLCTVLSVLGEISLRLSSYEERRVEAASLHAEAIHLANLGSYTASLPLFRAAVRMDQDHSLYLNDLGVTEMRVGDLQRAKKRFMHALAVDPNNQIAKDNLSELRSFMREEDFAIGLSRSYPQQHTIDSPLTVQPSELFALLSSPSSLELDQLLAKPFICRGALQEWGWRFLTSDYAKNKLDLPKEILSLLVQTFGGERVDFYPQGMSEESSQPFFISLEEAIGFLFHPRGTFNHFDASNNGTYIQWNLRTSHWAQLVTLFSQDKRWSSGLFPVLPKTLEDPWMENRSCFGINTDLADNFLLSTHWRMMLIGEKDSGMFLHKDTLRTASWQAQFSGEKKWHLCGPSEDSFMYRAGDIDAFRPDYDRFPLFREASCLQVTVGPGDVIYYPKDWWHQTQNLASPTISVTGTLVSRSNYASVREELVNNCEGRGGTFRPNAELCTALERCYETWERIFAS